MPPSTPHTASGPHAAAPSLHPRTPARLRRSRDHLRFHIATLRLRASSGSAHSLPSSTSLADPTGTRRRSLRLAHRRVRRCCRWASRRCARFGRKACVRRVHPTLAHPSPCRWGGGSRCGLKSGSGGVDMPILGVTSALSPLLDGVIVEFNPRALKQDRIYVHSRQTLLNTSVALTDKPCPSIECTIVGACSALSRGISSLRHLLPFIK